MKRKQVVIDKIEDMDNHLVSMYQAMQMPGVKKENIERYVEQVRYKLQEILNFVKLED
jgi:tetrahydromethanopterin S-methyltransferase subunit F